MGRLTIMLALLFMVYVMLAAVSGQPAPGGGDFDQALGSPDAVHMRAKRKGNFLQNLFKGWGKKNNKKVTKTRTLTKPSASPKLYTVTFTKKSEAKVDELAHEILDYLVSQSVTISETGKRFLKTFGIKTNNINRFQKFKYTPKTPTLTGRTMEMVVMKNIHPRVKNRLQDSLIQKAKGARKDKWALCTMLFELGLNYPAMSVQQAVDMARKYDTEITVSGEGEDQVEQQKAVVKQKPKGKDGEEYLYRVTVTQVSATANWNRLANQLMANLVAKKTITRQAGANLLETFSVPATGDLASVDAKAYDEKVQIAFGCPKPAATRANNNLASLIQAKTPNTADGKKQSFCRILKELSLDSQALDVKGATKYANDNGVKISVQRVEATQVNFPELAPKEPVKVGTQSEKIKISQPQPSDVFTLIPTSTFQITADPKKRIPYVINNLLELLLIKKKIDVPFGKDLLYSFGLKDSGSFDDDDGAKQLSADKISEYKFSGASPFALQRFLDPVIKLTKSNDPKEVKEESLCERLLEFAVDSKASDIKGVTDMAAKDSVELNGQSVPVLQGATIPEPKKPDKDDQAEHDVECTVTVNKHKQHPCLVDLLGKLKENNVLKHECAVDILNVLDVDGSPTFKPATASGQPLTSDNVDGVKVNANPFSEDKFKKALKDVLQDKKDCDDKRQVVKALTELAVETGTLSKNEAKKVGANAGFDFSIETKPLPNADKKKKAEEDENFVSASRVKINKAPDDKLQPAIIDALEKLANEEKIDVAFGKSVMTTFGVKGDGEGVFANCDGGKPFTRENINGYNYGDCCPTLLKKFKDGIMDLADSDLGKIDRNRRLLEILAEFSLDSDACTEDEFSKKAAENGVDLSISTVKVTKLKGAEATKPEPKPDVKDKEIDSNVEVQKGGDSSKKQKFIVALLNKLDEKNVMDEDNVVDVLKAFDIKIKPTTTSGGNDAELTEENVDDIGVTGKDGAREKFVQGMKELLKNKQQKDYDGLIVVLLQLCLETGTLSPDEAKELGTSFGYVLNINIQTIKTPPKLFLGKVGADGSKYVSQVSISKATSSDHAPFIMFFLQMLNNYDIIDDETDEEIRATFAAHDMGSFPATKRAPVAKSELSNALTIHGDQDGRIKFLNHLIKFLGDDKKEKIHAIISVVELVLDNGLLDVQSVADLAAVYGYSMTITPVRIVEKIQSDLIESEPSETIVTYCTTVTITESFDDDFSEAIKAVSISLLANGTFDKSTAADVCATTNAKAEGDLAGGSKLSTDNINDMKISGDADAAKKFKKTFSEAMNTKTETASFDGKMVTKALMELLLDNNSMPLQAAADKLADLGISVAIRQVRKTEQT